MQLPQVNKKRRRRPEYFIILVIDKMNPREVFGIVFYFLVFCASCKSKRTFNRDKHVKPEAFYSTLQFVVKNGYPAEAHVIKTQDGYFLEMHRIPPRKYLDPESGQNQGKKLPIILQHGLVASSSEFVVHRPNTSLAFLLADLGYDVWMPNLRGNRYSRGHVSLLTKDRRFWNFTFHESGVYDAPAHIDYICNVTGHEKLIYLGYSLGSTVFFILTSTLPEYNDKIALALMFSTPVFVGHMRSPLLKSLAAFSTKLGFLDLHKETGEYLLGKRLATKLCKANNLNQKLCIDAIYSFSGDDPERFDEVLLENFVGHYPSSSSYKTINHFLQLYKTGTFRNYDYGSKKNMLIYGTPEPPDYNLQNIRTPIYIYQGLNDYLSTMPDLEHLLDELKAPTKVFLVNNTKFSHIDFIGAKNVKEDLYDQVIKDINDFFK